jgi:lipopolysaccharide/colanic/teichoic acid biosynthesis glycosyltransferase
MVSLRRETIPILRRIVSSNGQQFSSTEHPGAREHGSPIRAAQAFSPVRRDVQLIEDAFLRSTIGLSYAGVSSGYRLAKRLLDVAVSATLLILLSPLFVFFVLLVRLDSPGPAFFIQERIGQGGRIFRMLKFRTMTHGATLIAGRIHKLEKDPRVTRIGRFLRQTSLDELPQLINVLKGEMSLVGPRPEIPAIALQRYQLWQYRRLVVPQGITGWWQVTGRGDKLLCEHTEDDIHYVERASLWFDIKILVMTFRAVLSKRGAF